MVKEQTDVLNVGELTIGFTGGNDMRLRALIRYAQFLDFRIGEDGESGEGLSVDGLVNYLLSNAMDKMIKDIIKKHSFDGEDDFYDTVAGCKNGEELEVAIREKERAAAEKLHGEILAYVPIDDGQKCLSF